MRNASAFSHATFLRAKVYTSSLHAYHFGAGAVNKEKITAKKRYTSYVPDGLTEEEYMKIKSDELAKQQKMNYGAWGPRFAPASGDPDNNWFNLPSLWTVGFNSNPEAGLLSSRSTDRGGEMMTLLFLKMVVGLRRYLLPYVTLLLSIHFFEASLRAESILQPMLCGKLTHMMIRVFAPLLALKPLDSMSTKLLGANKNGTTKLTCIIGLVLSAASLVLRRCQILLK